MTSAAFSIDPGTGTYGASLVAQDAAPSAQVHARVDSVTGITSYQWRITGTHAAAAAAPTITLSGSPTGQIATFDIPAGAGQAYGLELVVNGGLGPDNEPDAGARAISAVYVLDLAGGRPFFAGESSERSSTHYYVEELNRIGATASDFTAGVYRGNATTVAASPGANVALALNGAATTLDPAVVVGDDVIQELGFRVVVQSRPSSLDLQIDTFCVGFCHDVTGTSVKLINDEGETEGSEDDDTDTNIDVTAASGNEYRVTYSVIESGSAAITLEMVRGADARSVTVTTWKARAEEVVL